MAGACSAPWRCSPLSPARDTCVMSWPVSGRCPGGRSWRQGWRGVKASPVPPAPASPLAWRCQTCPRVSWHGRLELAPHATSLPRCCHSTSDPPLTPTNPSSRAAGTHTRTGAGLGDTHVVCPLPPLSCGLLGLPSVRRMGSVSEELSLVPLHQRPELLEACAKLLGEEWGKSRASRLHTLQRSSDAFPACLLLLRSRGPTEAPAARESPCQLVGHVRLSRVAGRPRDLFVESVVVARALRGQGYGRQLMEATERWARARGFRCLHLTTHDKQHFYAHLGFVLGEPVQSVAFLSPAIPAEVLRLFSAPPGAALPPATRPRLPSAPSPPLPPPTAPPPPPPPTVVWARGVLAESSGQSLLETPHRDAKGLPIFWMKKDI
ncbi:N-alpha-acetyltransferase 80 isoform X1 [Ciconia boyciana]|uniref:N-alpha-acetyltransferase 80 isoform X1 n=2 Tax=Ciconia boyciana TaxID=52775 RepID=UPI003B9FCFFD